MSLRSPIAFLLFVAFAWLPATAREISALDVASAAQYSRANGGQALIIRQGGRPLHESYANGGAAERAHWVMSLTKNLAALAILAAQADGLLALDEPAAKTLPEWRSRRITIRDLLTQTSGLATGYEAIYAARVRDKNRLALALPVVAPAGERFDYGPGNYEVLEEILRRKLAARGRDPLGYLQARVLTPIGVRPADWRRDRAGNPFFSAGAKLTARDVAKVGEFLRVRGRRWFWPVLPASAFRDAFVGTPANAMYGLSFWLNQKPTGATPLSIEGTLGSDRSPGQWRSSCVSSVAPADLVAMVGSGGLRCYIVPSRRLVVVRFGTGSRFSDAEFLRRLFASR